MKNEMDDMLAVSCTERKWEERPVCSDITTVNGGDSVTIMISEQTFENVEELTRIFNAWDKNDLTPAGHYLPDLANQAQRAHGCVIRVLYGEFGDSVTS